MTYLVQVDVPFACFFFAVNNQGRVFSAAPIARWMNGKPGRAMVAYWLKRGGKVTWQQAPGKG
jgi:hypothetical protein